MNQLYKRLYIFTGKGGVGKTTLSCSFAKYLKDEGKKVKLAYFQNSKLDENPLKYNEVAQLAINSDLDVLSLELVESCKNYIAKKLKSQTIASWVIKTPFFKSLINMIPGFNYLIYMGQILEILQEDPDLIIVLDSPSSGHALTMLEAPKNFNEIFASGILYNDTNTMLQMLSEPNFLQINIVTLPTTLAINEALELKKNIEKIGDFSHEIYCNYGLHEQYDESLPEILKNKITNESNTLDLHKDEVKSFVPYSLASSASELVKDLVPSMQNLV